MMENLKNVKVEIKKQDANMNVYSVKEMPNKKQIGEKIVEAIISAFISGMLFGVSLVILFAPMPFLSKYHILPNNKGGRKMIPPFKIAEDEFIAISTVEELLEYIEHAEELISTVRESRSKAYKELADRGLQPLKEE
ncbi:TPA_asm: hypothetical protein GYY92_14070 [Listeria monocytogenes]|nr:hypothetical protein [Listeria monocytogenes]